MSSSVVGSFFNCPKKARYFSVLLNERNRDVTTTIERLRILPSSGMIPVMRLSSSGWSQAVRLLPLGAIAFWWPDAVMHAIRGYSFNSHDALVVTVVMPLSFLLAFLATKRLDRNWPRKHVGLLMILGVWLFGGLFMMANASFSGGGFKSPEGIRWVMRSIFLSFIPVYTYILATYDGALGALMIVTLGGCVLSTVKSKWKPKQPQ